jgi:hypothetical protein
VSESYAMRFWVQAGVERSYRPMHRFVGEGLSWIEKRFFLCSQANGCISVR